MPADSMGDIIANEERERATDRLEALDRAGMLICETCRGEVAEERATKREGYVLCQDCQALEIAAINGLRLSVANIVRGLSAEEIAARVRELADELDRWDAGIVSASDVKR